MWRGMLWIVLFWLAGIACAQPSLLLETNISPPYQQVSGSRLTGESVETVRCVLNKLGHDFSIDVVPWKRARVICKMAGVMVISVPSPNLIWMLWLP